MPLTFRKTVGPMSELTECNHCTYLRMIANAAKRGATVILGKDEYGWVTARYSDEDYPQAYFMQLTEKCIC